MHDSLVSPARVRGARPRPPLISLLGIVVGTAMVTAVVAPAEGAAQSITSGEVRGTVVDEGGNPVERVRVVASSVTSGWERVLFTPRSGDFLLTQVPPGEYEILAEIIGYGPVQVVDVPVRPGQVTQVPISLADAPPPVMHIDTVSLDIGLPGIVTPGSGRWLQGDFLEGVPDRLGSAAALAGLTARLDASAGSEGLPSSMTQAFIDGVPFVPARHPLRQGGGLETLILPRSGLSYLAFPETQSDIEWQGGAGGYTAAGSRSGGQENSVDVFGRGSTDALWSSQAISSGVPSAKSFWGGASASVPLVSDTTRLFLATEGYRTETPRAGILDEATVGALPGLGDRSLAGPWVETTQAVSGIARVDWTLSPTSNLRIGALASALDVEDGLASRRPAPYGVTPPLQALDMMVSASLTARLFASTDLELRAAFQRSVREFPGADDEAIPGTRLVDSGGWVGLDPGLPTRVTRTGVVGGPTLHFSSGRHRVKAGGDFSIPSFEYETPSRGVGAFVFADPASASVGQGTYAQIAEQRPVSSFSLPRIGTFIQYAWDAATGLRITSGVRYDSEILPDEDVVVNREWVRASGVRADSLDPTLGKLAARVGIHWNLTGRGSTVLVAGAGTHHGDLDPGAVNEVLSYVGGIDVRRAVGAVGSWPALPDETAVPVSGERITLISPLVKSPRTRRAHLGLWQLIGDGTVLQASGSFRSTDYLLRRTDLNLVAAASGSDQNGRPVYGEAVQQGGLLTTVVGSNRRFREFDQVWALNPDGWSEQIAATFSIDHKAGDAVRLFGTYTWSETRDNWLGLASGQPDAALDPGLDDIRPTPWSDGTSDLDIPHRVAAGLAVHASSVTLRGVYRFRSGYPFTAGYRAGVDANGDGSALNDVAFVPDDPGVQELAGRWSCLASAVGRFAKRNSCRGHGVHSLDVSLSFDLAPSRGRRVEVVFDGLNLLESEVGYRDTALLLIDGSEPMSVDPATGDVSVPVVVNPSFGEILHSTSVGRMLRVGFRIGGGAR